MPNSDATAPVIPAGQVRIADGRFVVPSGHGQTAKHGIVSYVGTVYDLRRRLERERALWAKEAGNSPPPGLARPQSEVAA